MTDMQISNIFARFLSRNPLKLQHVRMHAYIHDRSGWAGGRYADCGRRVLCGGGRGRGRRHGGR